MAVDNTHFKGSWRPEEDEALRKAVAIHGEKNWSVVARHFNTLMGRHPNIGRAPKQCRSRFLQQLVPGIKTGEWTPEEEETLVEGHRQFGNQWTLISSMLAGRTETSVKNHYNCTARRKVPSDLSKMSVLQRYLATIGVINISGAGGGKGAASKIPALGSAYPNSSGSHFFSHHSGTAASMSHLHTRTSSRGGAAAAAAAAAPVSPAASEQQQHYDEDEEMYDQQQQQQQHYMMMMAQHHAPGSSPEYYEDYEAQQYATARLQQHKQLQQQQGSYAYGDSFEVDDQGMTEADAAEGAAAGLLQLARAALLHLEEDEETDEGCGGLSSQHQPVHQSCAADEDLQEQLQKHQLGAQHGQAKGSASWLRLELQSRSEESEKTAEDDDGEGSPMMAAKLQVHMMPRSASSAGGKRSTSGARTAVAEAGSNVSSKRHRSSTGAAAAAAAAVTAAAVTRASTEGGHGPFAFLRGAHGSSCSSLGGGKVRPVLDVSKPMSAPSFTTGFGSNTAAAATAADAMGTTLQAPEPHSPAATGGSNNSSPAGNAAGGVAPGGQALLAFMMSAFMGAAQGSASSSSAAALSPSHLAAIARAMALSALAGPGLSDTAHHGLSTGPSPAGCLAVDCTAAAAAAQPHSPGGGLHSPAAKGSVEGTAAAAAGLPSPGSAMSDMSAVLTALTREGSGVQQSSAGVTAPSTPLWPSLLEQQLKAVAAAAATAASVAAAHQ